jgi:hypothetical protein
MEKNPCSQSKTAPQTGLDDMTIGQILKKCLKYWK